MSTPWRIRLELRPPDASKPAAAAGPTEHAVATLQLREQYANALAPQLARMLVDALERRASPTPAGAVPP